MLVEGEIRLIKNRKRISLGGRPQRVTEKNDGNLINYDLIAPAAESVLASPKPEWDARPIIHVEKSKTNLTPKSKNPLQVTPKFVKGVQNRLDLNLDGALREKKDFKKMYYDELENTKALKKEVEKLKERIEELMAITPEHISLIS
jgi:hypothetical protein